MQPEPNWAEKAVEEIMHMRFLPRSFAMLFSVESTLESGAVDPGMVKLRMTMIIERHMRKYSE